MLYEFKIQRESEYDYVNGRVKVLETRLLEEDFFKKIISMSFDEIAREFEGTAYKQQINAISYESIMDGIVKRYNLELFEFERYLSIGFINTFFRSKSIFLSIREFALNKSEALDRKIVEFLKTGRGEFPHEFLKCYRDVIDSKDLPFFTGLAVSSNYIHFLSKSSLKTRIPLIIEYYEVYSSSYFIAMCLRLTHFVENNLINEGIFNKALLYLKKSLDVSEKYKDINDFSSFTEYVQKERQLYGFRKVSSREYILHNLKKIIEKSKSINTGIIPSFIYLNRLMVEVEYLLSILQLKDKGIQISESNIEGVFYE